MKILRIISSVNPENGGPIEGVVQTSRVLIEQGHQSEIVCLDAPDAPWVQAFPYPVHALGPARGHYGYTPALPAWLRAHAAAYDSIIVQGLWQYSSFGTWQTLHRAGIPYFIFPHGMLDPWFKQAYVWKHRKKCLYWRWGEYRVLRDAQAVLFTCEEERLLARQSFRPYHCSERVVNYGTAAPSGLPEAQRAQFLAGYPQLADKRLLLFLGRLHQKKGCDLLIEAFAGLAGRDSRLHLVMAGPDQTHWKPELQRLAQRLGIGERITWTGMLAGEQKWGALRAAEVFVLPSHQENFGIAVAEAMACGVPVLISNKVNIWREIEADRAGFVATDDRKGTQQLLEQWFTLSESRKQAMVCSAQACFARRFEINQVTQSLLVALAAPGVAKC